MAATNPARTAGRRRRLVAAAAAGAVLVVGVVLARVGTPDGTDTSRTQPVAASAPDHAKAGPVDADADADADDSGKGSAADAALAYTEASQQWLYLTDDQITAAVTLIATPDAGERIAADVVSDVSTSRARLTGADGAVWWIVRPLAFRSNPTGSGSARVDVWTLTVLSATGIAAPQSEFLTVTLDLRRVDGRWLVDAVRDQPGPTPVTGPHDQPWEADRFDDALAGFTRVGEKAAW